MEPAWLKSSADENFYIATLGPYELSIFTTMFGSSTYIVSEKGSVRKAGNVGDVETAKAKAVEVARETEAELAA